MSHSSLYQAEKIEVFLKRHVELELNLDTKKRITVKLLDSSDQVYELIFKDFTSDGTNYLSTAHVKNGRISSIKMSESYPEDLKDLITEYTGKVASYLQAGYFESQETAGWTSQKLFEGRIH